MSIGEYLKSIFSLEGKTILISGATGGIGSAISRGLAAAGAETAPSITGAASGAETALCARNQQKCRELADEISAHGGAATAHALDISDLDSIHRCVDEVMQRYGKIDVLFNVAGINRREGLLDVEPETYDRIMDTNLKGVFFLSQAVAREMYRRRAGNIINIGSHNDTGMLGGCSVYGASKSGVVALTRSMAVEFAQYGIRCNAISPGHILTDLTQVTWQHPTRSEYLRERIAMGRPGEPDELTGMAILLASDASSYMTGQAYHVDGGCLCGGRGDGVDQVDVVAHELVGDGLTRGLVVLGILLVDLDLKAAFLDGLDKAVVGGVERGVLGELQNTDGVVGTGGCRAGTRVAAASGERGQCEQAGRDQKAPAADGDIVHVFTPSRNGWKHCT